MLQICVKHIYIIHSENLLYGGGKMPKQMYKVLRVDAEKGEAEYECKPVYTGGSVHVIIPANLREIFLNRKLNVKLKVIDEEK